MFFFLILFFYEKPFVLRPIYTGEKKNLIFTSKVNAIDLGVHEKEKHTLCFATRRNFWSSKWCIYSSACIDHVI